MSRTHRADPAVIDIVAGMPAADAVTERELTARLVELGPAAILDICRMLLPPGAGDDTRARFALSGLSSYVHRPGAEVERKMYEEVLLAALEEVSDREVKAFLIRQLQLVGRDDAVAPLGRYLTDDRLCEPATQAMLAIGTGGVEIELLRALPSASEGGCITIVKALGELRSKAAAYEVLKYTASDNEDLRQAALYALANIGPVSTEALLAEAAAASSPYDRTKAVSLQLLYAARLAEAGREDECARICRHLIRTRIAPGEESTRIAALTTLVEVVGEAALPDLIRAASSLSAEIRRSALQLAHTIPGSSATLQWFNMQQRVSLQVRDEVRAMLRERNKEYPVPVVEEAIRQWDEARQAVAWASMDSLTLAGEGFVSLFNGVDLAGWVGDMVSYFVEEGKIVVDPRRRGGSGNLYTQREYSNFVLRLQFRLTPGANNGLGIRVPLGGDAAYVGMELQILDNSAEQYANLKPYQFHGSIYGVVPAQRGYLNPVGEWNCQEVIADSSHVTVILNGTVIVDADIDEAGTPATMDGRDHPGLKREKGHIGFLGHGSRVEFRNIWIKEID